MAVPWFFHTPVALITCMDKFKKPNIITIAWIGIVNTEPPMIGVSIRSTSYSYDCIKKSKAFVVNIPSESMVEKVDFCGSVSGRKINKFRVMGFTPVFAKKVKAPMIEECAAHL